MHPSNVPKLAHALISSAKINVYGLIQTFPYIFYNNCIAFSSYPSFAYFVSFLFHVEKFNYIMCNSIIPNSITTHGEFCLPPPPSSQNSWWVFLCLNLSTFHLFTTKTQIKLITQVGLHILSINSIKRTYTLQF